MADGNDLDMEHKIRNYLTALQVWSGSDKGQVENIDRGMRRLVEARSRATGREQTAEQEQGKQVRFAGEEQPGEKRAQSTHEQDVMDGLEEVRTGRGSAGLARRERTGVTRTRPAERAKAKGNGGKGEHGSKGETGSKGMHQVTNMMKGDDDEKEKVNQRGDDECRETKFEWELRRLEEKRRALEEHEQRHEEEEKCENDMLNKKFTKTKRPFSTRSQQACCKPNKYPREARMVSVRIHVKCIALRCLLF